MSTMIHARDVYAVGMTTLPHYLDSMGRRLGFASRAVQALTGELLAEHGLTPPQWIVLTALWREDGMTVSAIAHYTKAKVPAASRLIGRMEDQGLVKRKLVKDDRRAVCVWLTPKAQDMSALLEIYDEVNEMLLDGFSDAEKKRLTKYLDRLTTNATRRYAEKRADDPLTL